MSKFITRDINLRDRRRRVDVDVPELECTIRLRELSYGQIVQMKEGDADDQIKQLALMIVDGDDNIVFTTEADLANLAHLPASAMNRILPEAHKLNGTSKEAIEAAAKNSSATLKKD